MRINRRQTNPYNILGDARLWPTAERFLSFVFVFTFLLIHSPGTLCIPSQPD